MRLYLPGGCGYIGSQLTVHLLAAGHRVFIHDPGWFGMNPPDNPRVELVDEFPGGIDAVIYLAGLSKDSECEKHPVLAREANVLSFMKFLKQLKNQRLIFLSSAAAYGNTATPALEKTPLHPTTLYGTHKQECEVAVAETGYTEAVILRPAGVCGYSSRMRFDLTVNRMARDAFFTGRIQVDGGRQTRPHLHIRDLIDVVIHFLQAGRPGIYNISHDNQTIIETAKRVSSVIPADLMIGKRTDNRSYLVSNKKLERLGIICGRTVEKAAQDLRVRFKSGYWKDAMSAERYMNVPAL